MRCANEGCDKDPDRSLDCRMVTADADFVCDAECEAAYKRRRDHFLNNVVHSPELTERWLKGEIDGR